MLNAEVKEGEILPPTIQKLMKGYNKYLRPFFDSKETHAPMEIITQLGWGDVCDSEQGGGVHIAI